MSTTILLRNGSSSMMETPSWYRAKAHIYASHVTSKDNNKEKRVAAALLTTKVANM